MSKLYLNLPTVTLLCKAEKGKMSLVYIGLKMFDGHSMFKPLKQDGVKYVAVSIATGVKSKVRIFLSFCLSCLLHHTPEKTVRTSLKLCMYNTDLVQQTIFKGHNSVPSRHCPLALSQHIWRSSKRQGAGVERNVSNPANCQHLAQNIFSLTIATSTCPEKRIRSGQA